MLDPDGLPLSVLRNPDGSPVQITLALPDDASLHARIWQASVGPHHPAAARHRHPRRTPTSCAPSPTGSTAAAASTGCCRSCCSASAAPARCASFTSLSGTPEPDVFHMNEGHAGFLGLERIATYIGEGLTLRRGAAARARRHGVHDAHAVPAGIDRFDRWLVERYLTSSLLPGVEPADALALGVEPGADRATSAFNMAVMGLRLAQHANGVSKLHGEVSRRMFGDLWPGFDADDVPITSITNGVHAPTWTDAALLGVAESSARHGRHRARRLAQPGAQRRRVLERASGACACSSSRTPGGASPRRGASSARAPPRRSGSRKVLDPDTLTVGFARRVPTYKRLTLMLQDPERLKSILTNPERPVQFVIAGKSHPADDEGKRLIQQLVQFAQQPELRDRIVFLPDYDIGMAAGALPGLRRLAQQPAAPARGVRHVGHEGRPERRAQPVDPRRLVGRVRGRRLRLGDSVGRCRGRRGRTRRARGGGALRAARASRRARGTTSATTTACRSSGCAAFGRPSRRWHPSSVPTAWCASTSRSSTVPLPSTRRS